MSRAKKRTRDCDVMVRVPQWVWDAAKRIDPDAMLAAEPALGAKGPDLSASAIMRYAAIVGISEVERMLEDSP